MRRRQGVVGPRVFAWIVEVTSIRKRGARGNAEKGEGAAEQEKFHAASKQMPPPVSTFRVVEEKRLRTGALRGKFRFRQGLWTEGVRIPPGQECSNGSLILFAVVLWRSFL